MIMIITIMHRSQIGFHAYFPFDRFSEGWSIKPSPSLPHEEVPDDEGGDEDEGELVEESQALLD